MCTIHEFVDYGPDNLPGWAHPGLSIQHVQKLIEGRRRELWNGTLSFGLLTTGHEDSGNIIHIYIYIHWLADNLGSSLAWSSTCI